MQKSRLGLIYSLLYSVLDSHRELIPRILPGLWKIVMSGRSSELPDPKIHHKDVEAGFARLISDPKLYENHSFCFFIDGLDEFEGSYQEDAKLLMQQLCSWTTNAPDNVKLCVSSREYNVFMNAFSDSNRIRLHQLTRLDMMHYVSDKLEHLEHGTDKVKITKAIVDNTNGIFL